MSIKIANGMDFINDEKVIGKWEFFDSLSSIENFDLNKKQASRSNYNFKEIYFMPNGQRYWIFEGWTKGYLLVHHGGDEPVLCFKYEIKEYDNDSYLFIDVNDNNGKRIEVLKKVSSKEYQLMEIGNRENIDVDFVYDENIIGLWNAVAFVSEPSEFDDKKKYNNVWVKSIIFNEDGTAKRIYFDRDLNDYWTKGYLIDKEKSVLSKYEIKEINGTIYLFLQWKMGNYVYGGEKSEWYVFKR